jgi:hypothetical protein
MADKLEAWTHEDALDAGFFGARVDPTPNHAYTLEGVGAGEPTPETDAGAKQAAQEHLAKLTAATAAEPTPKAKSTPSSAKAS